jgi:uncharacterized protein (DUF433 family)
LDERLAPVDAEEGRVIERSDEILGGVLVFAGTRVPVQALLDYLEAGDRLDDFLDDYPTVSREQAVRALDLAGRALVSRLAGA